MSTGLIWLALPMGTLLSGMGTMVGSLFLEKANLWCKYKVVMRGLNCTAATIFFHVQQEPQVHFHRAKSPLKADECLQAVLGIFWPLEGRRTQQPGENT